jgi:hypothetical protein
MPRYAGVLLDLFGTLVLAEPERLPVLRIGATSVRTTVSPRDAARRPRRA